MAGGKEEVCVRARREREEQRRRKGGRCVGAGKRVGRGGVRRWTRGVKACGGRAEVKSREVK
jgi:hypothetical protein